MAVGIRKLVIVGLALAVIVIPGVMGSLRLLQTYSLAAEARNSIQAAVDMAAAGDLEAARRAFETAVRSLGAAQERIDSPWVSLVSAVPYVSTEARAGSAGITAVRETSLAILEVLEFVLAERAPLLDAGGIDGAAMVLLESALGAALDHAVDARSTIAGAPSARLQAIRDPLAEVDRATTALVSAITGARALVSRLGEAASGGDPFRLLVLFENGAELRGTGGLMGFVALFEISDGVVEMRRAEEVGRLQGPSGEPLSVDAPADYLGRYGGFLANTTLWSNVNLSPDFPTVADVAGRLYTEVTGIQPDLIARVDLVGLGYLLGTYSGLAVDGVPIAPETLATDFVIESYTQFPDAEQGAYLAAVVRQVFDQLIAGAEGDMVALLRGVHRAVRERHIAFATDDPAIGRLLALTGADGALLPGEPGDVNVVVQNFAANKIDIFTRTEISVGLEPVGCFGAGEVTVTLRNLYPEGEPAVLGTLGGRGRWWVSFYLPRQAEIVALSVDGEPSGGSTDIELGRRVASVLVGAEPGAATTATIRWYEELTGPEYRLRVQPQPLVAPATLSIGAEAPLTFLETQTASILTDCKS